MLVVDIVLLISEIIATILVGYYNVPFLNYLSYRIHWATGIVWFGLLYYYCFVFVENIKADNLMEIVFYNKKTKNMAIIFLICSVIYFFVPFENLNPLNVSYIPGFAAYYVLAFCTFIAINMFVIIWQHKGPVPFRKKISVWILLVELALVTVLQLIFPLIAIIAIGTAVQMYFLYFNIENPDLKIISELETVKNDIERSNKAKSDFLSNMSHEIRSPMNAIVGFSETLLNDPKFDEKSAKIDIKHIADAGNNLLDIINNILDISKIESGKETLEKKNYSLGSIILELTSIVEARIGDRPIKFITNVDEKLPSKLYGDSTKIFQVLLNILTNSVKYTEVGRITLDIKCETKDDYVLLHFKVSDTGYGIKKEDYGKIFSKFARLENATSNEIEGTGLGLAITK